MIGVEAGTINPNNDFDQNTVIQPEKTHLMPEQRKVKNKSEMDLIDVIGGSWSGNADILNLDSFSNIKKNLETNENIKDKIRKSSSNTIKKTAKFYVTDFPEAKDDGVLYSKKQENVKSK